MLESDKPQQGKQSFKNDADRNTAISPEMRQILEEEVIESEIESAIDAASAEGIFITREEAIKILLNKEFQDSD